MVCGYKAFNEDYTTINGDILKPNIRYHIDTVIKYGSNGYHFAKNMEDTIRYTPFVDEYLHAPQIALVKGLGKIESSFDEYNDYENLYVSSDIVVLKYLTREEIIDMALNLSMHKMVRFVSLYKLNEEEIKLFYGKFIEVDMAIDYYQRKITNTYELDENKVYKRKIKNKI